MSSTVTIRSYNQSDQTEILRLNEESVAVLSPMDANRFKKLADQARITRVAEVDNNLAGFLLGFDDQADYDSINYGWFRSHYDNFLYIDRIVIGKNFRGHGIGQKIYAELDSWCRDHNIARLVAEVDIEPPNHASLKFHQRSGFEEVGQFRSSPTKCVSMQMKQL